MNGLLGMASLAGTGPRPDSSASPGALTPPAQAVAGLSSAGAMLESSDRLYEAGRRSLVAAPGHGRLPASAWVGDPAVWTTGPLGALVAQMSASPSLVPTTAVALTAVRLDPSVLPPAAAPPGSPPTAPGVGVVPPTRTLTVTVTLGNVGNVDLPSVTVSASLTPQGPGRAATSTRTLSLGAGTSEAAILTPLPVGSDDTYLLTVAVTPPAAQVNRADLLQRYLIHVAPAT